jgi:hypothetical protein
LNIPIVAMVDTNCDPQGVDYVIPSNDDAIRAIKLLVAKVAEAALEGLGSRKEEVMEEPVQMVAHVSSDERELTDEELLGEATLAKLTPRGKVEEVVVEELEAELAAVEEIAAKLEPEEEVAAEPVDQAEEEAAVEPVDQAEAEEEAAVEPVDQVEAEEEAAVEPVDQAEAEEEN